MRLYELNEVIDKNSFPDILKDEHKIASYISSIASDYVDEEMIEEYFRGCYAILKTVDITNLKHGDADHNIINKNKLKKYMKLKPDNIPPLVVEDGVVMDGNHRFEVAKKLGLESIKIYDIKEK